MFLLPTPTYFTDSQKTLYYSISQSRLTPSSADPCSAPSWLHPYSCLRPFLKKASMSIPPSLLRVTITLDLGLISYIRRFRTFKSLKAFGAALRLPSQSPDIVRVSHRCGGRLTTPGHYKPTISIAGIPFNGTIGCRPVNVQPLKDWSSTRQASRKESARGSNYAQDVIKLHSKRR